MTRLHALLVRHARFRKPAGTPSAHLPYGLTAKGVRQAIALAETIRTLASERGAPLDPVIDCSSLLRAWQTASRVADELGAASGGPFTVAPFDALMERSLGSAANLSMEKIHKIVSDDPRLGPLPSGWRRRPDFRPPFPGAESPQEAGARMASHVGRRLHELARSGPSDVLKVFVGHNTATIACLRHLGVPGLEPGARLPHCGTVLLEHCGDGAFELVSATWKVAEPLEP